MGDHRLNVKISLVGSDGKERAIDWYVNYSDDIPKRLNDAVIKLIEESGFNPDIDYMSEDVCEYAARRQVEYDNE